MTTLSAFILLCISSGMCSRYYSLFWFSFAVCCHEVFWSLSKQLASCTIFAVCILFCVANYDASAESREVCLLEQRVNSVSVLEGWARRVLEHETDNGTKRMLQQNCATHTQVYFHHWRPFAGGWIWAPIALVNFGFRRLPHVNWTTRSSFLSSRLTILGSVPSLLAGA